MTDKKKNDPAKAVSPPAQVVAATPIPDEDEIEHIGFRRATLGIPEQTNKDYFDPVVQSLDVKDRPQIEVVCQHCPGACFFTTHNALACFCKHMNTVSWSHTSPIPITRCTAQGIFVAQWKAKQAEGG